MPPGPRRVLRAPLRRGPRRTSTWVTTDQSLTVAAGAHSNLDLWSTLEVAGSSALGLTVLRTLVLVHVRNFAAVADRLTMGLIIEDKSFVGTVTDLAANATRDWYWYTGIFPDASGAAITVAKTVPANGTPIDIRAKRKTADLNRTSILAITNQGGVDSHNVDVLVRQLVALP